LGGEINYTTDDKAQFIHSNGSGSNLIKTASANDTVILYAKKDEVSLGAGQDRVHILSGSNLNNIDLGLDHDADRVYFYRPTLDQDLSYLVNFDPSLDTILLLNLDTSSSTSFTISPTKSVLLIDSKPMLELIGSFSSDQLNAAIRRSDRDVTDVMASISERGLLVTEMIPGLQGTSQQHIDGQWYGYNVDIARAITEQLTGNADALAILPNQSLLAGLNSVRDGYADIALLGSTNSICQDVNLGIDFSQPYLVDAQSFLVLGLKSTAELTGQNIGVIAGSTAKDNAMAFLTANGIQASVAEYSSSLSLIEALRSHEIAAIASDRTRLMGYQATVSGSSLLEVTFSIQPLVVALPENQSQLKDAVNWIIQTPTAATELGISSTDLPDLIAQAERGGADLNAIDPQTRVFLELDTSGDSSSSLGTALGLARGFTQKVLDRLGNASELWHKHFPIAGNIEQNMASEGGQHHSLPFFGQGSTDPLIDNDNRGDLLGLIRKRGSLCVATGGSAANIGFSAPDENGTLQGVDADIARAIAVAIFGNASRVTFVTNLPFSSTFAAVANGEVDLALRATENNLWRDGSLDVDFSDSYLTTGLKVLSHASLGISRIVQLNGTSIGVIKGTTAAQSLNLAMSKTGKSARIVTYDDATELYKAFQSGTVQSIAREGALLASFQQELAAEANPIETTMLNGHYSYEQIAVVVDEDQSKFLDLVNAVIAILKHAAECGVTSANVDQKLAEAKAENAPAALRQLFKINPAANSGLSSIGLTTQRIIDIILSVGNIDQIIQRSIANPDRSILSRTSQLHRPL
jgi:general L-amino acid transport system substrate-binding protein